MSKMKLFFAIFRMLQIYLVQTSLLRVARQEPLHGEMDHF